MIDQDFWGMVWWSLLSWQGLWRKRPRRWEDSAAKLALLGALGVSFLSVSIVFSSMEHVRLSVTYKLKVLVRVPPPTQINICYEISREKKMCYQSRGSSAQPEDVEVRGRDKVTSLRHQPLSVCSTCLWWSASVSLSCHWTQNEPASKRLFQKRNCWTGLTGLRDARRGRVGGRVSTLGQSRASVLLLQPWWLSRSRHTMCPSFHSATVSIVWKEMESLGGQEFFRLSFWTTTELQWHILSDFFPVPNPDCSLILIY